MPVHGNDQQIDPRHRYGHNLHLYYDIWFQTSSTEPFFYWCVCIAHLMPCVSSPPDYRILIGHSCLYLPIRLDIGAGREIHHPSCPRTKLNSQLVMYLGMVRTSPSLPRSIHQSRRVSLFVCLFSWLTD